MPVSAARAHLRELISRAVDDGESVYLTRRGQRVAAIVPASLLEAYEAAEDAADRAAVRAALAEDGPPVSLEQMRAELDAEGPGTN